MLTQTRGDKKKRGTEEDIYWLKRDGDSPDNNKQCATSPPCSPRNRVTFEEPHQVMGMSPRYKSLFIYFIWNVIYKT